MRLLLKAAMAAQIALLASAGAASAQSAPMIRATCTSKGTKATVYREDIPVDASAERRLMIASKYPDALCMFLKISDIPPEQRLPSAPADPILGGAAGSSLTMDESLAAALNVLSGKSDDAGPASSSAARFSNAFATPMMQTAPEVERPKPLNLTIGVYRSVPMQDVVAHWKTMQAGTEILTKMTPSISIVGDVTMLSIENVPDELAARLCDEAKEKGAGCIAVF
jgi:hypothetical protein